MPTSWTWNCRLNFLLIFFTAHFGSLKVALQYPEHYESPLLGNFRAYPYYWARCWPNIITRLQWVADWHHKHQNQEKWSGNKPQNQGNWSGNTVPDVGVQVVEQSMIVTLWHLLLMSSVLILTFHHDVETVLPDSVDGSLDLNPFSPKYLKKGKTISFLFTFIALKCCLFYRFTEWSN